MQPLISCICPTRNRRKFIPQMVRCFESQTWQHKELIVVDNGDEPICDLLPRGTRYVHVPGERRTTGWMRNMACSLARGDFIINYDDDDWSHPLRMQEQYKLSLCNQIGLVGYKSMYFLNEEKREAWLYITPAEQYALGTSFFYTRDYWRAHKYPDIAVGEDNEFGGKANYGGLLAVDANDRMVARIHSGNTSPKLIWEDETWRRAQYEAVAAIMGLSETVST